MPTLEEIFGNDVVTPDETFTEFDGGVVFSNGSRALDNTSVMTPMGYSLAGQTVDVEMLRHEGFVTATGEEVDKVFTIRVRDLPDNCFDATESTDWKNSDCERVVYYAFLDKKLAIKAFTQIISDNLALFN